jgi:hypothetical protein
MESYMTDTQIPVEHLFTVVMQGMDAARHDYAGPFGRRIFAKATGGSVTGKRFSGKVLPLHATDYGRASADGTIRQFDAEVGLQEDDGTVVLMQYRGRMSPTYGPGQSRIQVLFDVQDGPHGWMNGVQAMGFGTERPDGSTVFEIYSLTGDTEFEGLGQGDNVPAIERTSVSAEFVLRRKSEHEAGSTRHTVTSPFGARYFTLAETGGKFAGPRISGDFLAGYSWSPHRMSPKGTYGQPDFEMRMHYDVKTLLQAEDGTSILMSYTGATSAAYAGRCWMTATQFEVPEGQHAWLNEILAIGVGRWQGDGAEYKVYALR